MNIGSGSSYPACALSNFPPHPIIFDGVEVTSAEGFLQSLKFDKPHIQVEVCKLFGKAAKFRGKKRNKAWQQVQKLWWLGAEYDRHGDDYQELIARFYDELAAKSESFRNALIASGRSTLTHSIGHNDPSKTILTEREFCSNLTRVRSNWL